MFTVVMKIPVATNTRISCGKILSPPDLDSFLCIIKLIPSNIKPIIPENSGRYVAKKL